MGNEHRFTVLQVQVKEMIKKESPAAQAFSSVEAGVQIWQMLQVCGLRLDPRGQPSTLQTGHNAWTIGRCCAEEAHHGMPAMACSRVMLLGCM